MVKFSNLLTLLLLYAKRSDSEFDYEHIKQLLGEMYSYDMKMKDVLFLLVQAFNEANMFDQFKIPYRGDSARVLFDLLYSPFESYDIFNPITQDTQFTVAEIINKYIASIMSTLRLTDVGWCKEALGLPEGEITVSDDLLAKARGE